jgi:hypothetical protein
MLVGHFCLALSTTVCCIMRSQFCMHTEPVCGRLFARLASTVQTSASSTAVGFQPRQSYNETAAGVTTVAMLVLPLYTRSKPVPEHSPSTAFSTNPYNSNRTNTAAARTTPVCIRTVSHQPQHPFSLHLVRPQAVRQQTVTKHKHNARVEHATVCGPHNQSAGGRQGPCEHPGSLQQAAACSGCASAQAQPVCVHCS